MIVVKTNCIGFCVLVLLSGVSLTAGEDSPVAKATKNVGLLQVYPTNLKMGCTDSAKARKWTFRPEDIFELSKFSLSVGDELKLKTKTADVGIGHCKDGAVWALVIPRTSGTMQTVGTKEPQDIDHIWLRFHPAEIENLFPPETVSTPGNEKRFTRMQQIANWKIRISWQGNGRALIPGRKDMTVDVDTRNRREYFFGVKRKAVIVQHVAPVKPYSALAGKSPAAKEPRKKPFPDSPFHQRKLDPNQPKVISASPADGTTDVEPNTVIRIRFDKPMDPDSMLLLIHGGSFSCTGVRYNEAEKEFTIPASLDPGGEYQLSLDFGHHTRFRDTERHPAAPYRWAFAVKDSLNQPEGSMPRLLSCSPASGAEMPLLTELCLTFDQPMDLSDLDLVETSGESQPHLRGRIFKGQIRYDDQKRKAFVPLLFSPNRKGTVQLVHARNRQGVEADPIEFAYATGKKCFREGWLKQLDNRRRRKDLVDVLNKIKEARSKIKSLSVTTHSWSRGPSMIQAGKTAFRMQGEKQFYGDAGSHMPLYVGCDGKNCWNYYGKEGKESLVFVPQEEVKKNVVICDPFDLTRRGIDEAVEKDKLEYLGIDDVDGRKCHCIQSWSIRVCGSMAIGNVKKFWIDVENYRPVMVEMDMGGFGTTYRFVYDRINQSMQTSDFLPSPAKGVKPQKPEPIKKEYKCDRRALNVMDGSNGRISVWWGQTGQSGSRCGSGVN